MGRKSKILGGSGSGGDYTNGAEGSDNVEPAPPTSASLPVPQSVPAFGAMGVGGVPPALQGLWRGPAPGLTGPTAALSANPLLTLMGTLGNNPLMGLGGVRPPVLEPQPTVDPDVQELCDHYHVEDRHARRLSELMRNRQETFEEDLAKLWDVLETARSPAGLLTVKMREMDEGTFVGKSKPDKELEAMGRKYKLDDQAVSKLADVLGRRKDTRKQDMEDLHKHLEISNRPSAMAMMLLGKLREGLPLGQPDRAPAPGSYRDRAERERARDEGGDGSRDRGRRDRDRDRDRRRSRSRSRRRSRSRHR